MNAQTDDNNRTAVAGPVERQVRPHAPVAEVVCYETPRYGRPPVQTYELRQLDPFRALPTGTHQLYTQSTLDAALMDSAEAMALVLSHEDRIQRLTDALTRNGFVRCDIPACNCGSWHARFGLPERMAELKQLLDDAGHSLCNENGNSVSKALAGLIAERDALIAALHDVGRVIDAARKALKA